MFRAPGTWLGFWTINRTGVQTYLIALTAMPFFAIALEATAAHLGWVAAPNLSAAEWIAAAVILAASTWLIVVSINAACRHQPANAPAMNEISDMVTRLPRMAI